MPDASWLHLLAGRFIAFEGPDGSGKSTQLRRFVRLAADAGLTVREVREPGGTIVGEAIRSILLDHAQKDMTLTCEMMLYMASRAQLVEQTIRPALARGELVIADRFLASTLAYQGSAGGMPEEEIRAVAAVALHGCLPDLNIVFDVDEQTAARRLSPLLDRMEAKGRDYHRRVCEGYRRQLQRDPAHYRRVDAGLTEPEVWTQLVAVVRAHFAGEPARA